jgi:putative tryptophan/tyrosine transport system substrate-binding protein
VASGFIQSLAHPGGNVTGLSLQSSDIGNKRLEILREAIPGLKHLAVMANANYLGSARESAAVQETARRLGLAADALDIHRADDIVPAITSVKDRAKALYICTDSLVVTNWQDQCGGTRGQHCDYVGRPRMDPLRGRLHVLRTQ